MIFRWFRKKPKLPEIPPHRPIEIDYKPPRPKDPDYVVEQREMSDETGMFYFPWLKKKDDSQ